MPWLVRWKPALTATLLLLTALAILSTAYPGGGYDFVLKAWGPSSVYAGGTLYFGVRGEMVSGSDDYSVVPSVTGLPPGATAEFYALTKYCCGDYLWRATTWTPVIVRTSADTPAGQYTLSVTYRSFQGLARSVSYPVVVRPAPGKPDPPAAYPPDRSLDSLAAWERNMTTYGLKHCTETETQIWEGFAWFYDGARAYYQIADYTRDQSWSACALLFETAYRQYVVENKGGLAAWRIFPHGLATGYRRRNDEQSLAAIQALRDADPGWEWYLDWTTSREAAYRLNVLVTLAKLGQPRDPNLDVYADIVMGHFEQWFHSKKADYTQPFMVALSAEALIGYHDLTGDSRVLPHLKTAADQIWAQSWDPASGSFKYWLDSVRTEPAADANLLIAPLYGWLYRQTADPLYRAMGDAAFSAGVQRAWLDGGKQFTQNYRWSFDYLNWTGAPKGAPKETFAPNGEPQAVVRADPQSGLAPLNVVFCGKSSLDPDGDPLSYHWDFGDGAEADGVTVVHLYSQPGKYVAVLTVTDIYGASGRAKVTVSVDAAENSTPTELKPAKDAQPPKDPKPPQAPKPPKQGR